MTRHDDHKLARPRVAAAHLGAFSGAFLALAAVSPGAFAAGPLVAPSAPAAPLDHTNAPAADHSHAVTLDHEVAVELIYLDALKRPAKDAIGPVVPTASGLQDGDGLTAPAPEIEQPRVLGLRRARLGLTWTALDSASLSLVLRPDAANKATETGQVGDAHELDTRAGIGKDYADTPTVRLLDAYQLNATPTAALSAGVGVYEEITPAARAFPEILGFGLTPFFPTKFSAVRVGWRYLRPSDPAAADTGPSGLRTSLFVLQGDNDRAEKIDTPNGGRYDRAPVAQDPYQGGSFTIDLDAGWNGTLSLLAGYIDNHVTAARRGDAFAALGATERFDVMGRSLVAAAEARYLSQKWRGDRTGIKPRLQASLDATAALEVASGTWALLEGAYGLADHDPEVYGKEPDARARLSGYEIEAGVLRALGRSLRFQLGLAQERRRIAVTDDASRGAFGDYNDDPRSIIRRMAASFTYELAAEP